MLKTKERLFYLLTILGLLCAMSYEFSFFTKHYAKLEKLAEYMIKTCNP